jgi:hypothetical protein
MENIFRPRYGPCRCLQTPGTAGDFTRCCRHGGWMARNLDGRTMAASG